MERLYDLVIIGGGPAGITAGIYAARKKLRILLLTKDFLGQVAKTSEVDNWPGTPGVSGMKLMKSFEKHLKKFAPLSPIEGKGDFSEQDLYILEGEVVFKVQRNRKRKGQFLVKTASNKQFSARAIIAAPGRDPRHLNIPGEKKFTGRGISYCPTCDAPFFKDKHVAVVGGGNSGFESALDLAKYAAKIFIFERGARVIADEILQERVKKQKHIEIHLNKEMKEIVGNGNVQALIYQDLVNKKTFQVPLNGVFIEIGSIPAAGFLKGLVDFNKKNEIKIDPATCATSVKGIFAAGDVNDNPHKQIVTAVGDGCRAALAAYDYLQNNL